MYVFPSVKNGKVGMRAFHLVDFFSDFNKYQESDFSQIYIVISQTIKPSSVKL